MTLRKLLITLGVCVLAALKGQAQSATDMPVLKGLATVTLLLGTDAGKAALAANYSVTGGIQTGALRQPDLAPFAGAAPYYNPHPCFGSERAPWRLSSSWLAFDGSAGHARTRKYR